MNAPTTTVAFALLISVTTCCLAGDAVFCGDGKRIYSIADQGDKPAVQEIDLQAKTIRSIVITSEIRGIACGADSKLFCTTANALCSFDPISGALTKVRDADAGTEFWRVAYSPKIQHVVVTTDSEEHPMFIFKGRTEWIPVRMRRHPSPSCLVFSTSGEMFFAAYGDLWHGEIQEDEGNYAVAAYRYAPLATLEIENSTPSQIGVGDIGIGRDEIYVQLKRMGGSGDGWFSKLARPKPKRLDEGYLDLLYDPKDRLPLYQKALASLKILGDDFRAGNIAVSPDERRVHYVMNGKHWLVTDGKTEELRLTQK